MYMKRAELRRRGRRPARITLTLLLPVLSLVIYSHFFIKSHRNACVQLRTVVPLLHTALPDLPVIVGPK